MSQHKPAISLIPAEKKDLVRSQVPRTAGQNYHPAHLCSQAQSAKNRKKKKNPPAQNDKSALKKKIQQTGSGSLGYPEAATHWWGQCPTAAPSLCDDAAQLCFCAMSHMTHKHKVATHCSTSGGRFHFRPQSCDRVQECCEFDS